MAFNAESIGQPIDERYPEDLAVASLERLAAALLTWVARDGSPEVVLIEAAALAVADIVNAANATIGAVEEDMLARFYGVPRRPGAAAVGELLLTFDSAVTTTIPAGMGFLIPSVGVEVQTTVDVPLTAALTATVQVASVEATTALNGVGLGTGVDVLDVIPNLLTVEISTTFAGGADPETDEAYVLRAQARLARVTNSLVVPDHFSAYVLEDGRASNALTIPAWDGASIATAGSDAGEVTVVCYGFGAQLSSEVRAELATAMQAITAAGITVNVTEVALTTVNVTATVAARPGYDAAEVQAAAVDAVRAYLSPEVWTFGQDVATGAIEAAMVDTAAVDYVVSLTAPAADVTIPANGAPIAGTVTVSVV